MTSKPRKRRTGLVIIYIYIHVRENKKHIFDWNNRNFLEIDNSWRRRKIKEALYIDSINPHMEINLRKLMNPEKGTDISDCWKEFYQHMYTRNV